MYDIRLILHIGAGKTGTSSIQRTLGANFGKLKKQGTWYLGMILENAHVKIYDWQDISKIGTFHTLSEQETKEQVLEVMHSILNFAQKEKIHTLIWSNESFFNKNQKLLSVLKSMELEGFKIEIVSYVRRHDAWVYSSYVQWGIKHKTYSGSLLPFHEWSKTRIPRFYPQLSKILELFPKQLYIRNMDAVQDVVKDFFKILHIDFNELEIIRFNDSPGNEELLLRALFNNNFDGQVLPVQFNNFVSDKIINTTLQQYMQDLLPMKEDLEKIVELTVDDRLLLNKILKEQGQDPIEINNIICKSAQINSEIILLALCDIVLKQIIKIRHLEELIKEKTDSKLVP